MNKISFSNVSDIFMNSNGNWTISSILGEIFNEIENLYGKRDMSFTILGVELSKNNQPQTWFPGDRGHVLIQLTESCRNNIVEAVYQTAHEAVHCLFPKPFGSATYFEEGLATYFAKKYILFQQNIDMPITIYKYQQAYDLVCELLSIDNSIIKRIREKYPDISSIDKNQLLQYGIPELLADKLTTNFQQKI